MSIKSINKLAAISSERNAKDKQKISRGRTTLCTAPGARGPAARVRNGEGRSGGKRKGAERIPANRIHIDRFYFFLQNLNLQKTLENR